MSFKTRLSDSMLKAGYSQSQLAELIGVTRSAVNYWQNSEDDERMPNTANLKKCADALGVDPRWLRFGDELEVERQNLVALPEKQSIISLIPILKIGEIGGWLRQKTNGREKMQAHQQTGTDIKNILLDNDSMVDPINPVNSLYPGTVLTIDKEFEPNSIKPGTIVVAQFGMTDNYKVRQYQKDGTDEYLKAFNPDIARVPINDNVKIVAICIYQSRSML